MNLRLNRAVGRLIGCSQSRSQRNAMPAKSGNVMWWSEEDEGQCPATTTPTTSSQMIMVRSSLWFNAHLTTNKHTHFLSPQRLTGEKVNPWWTMRMPHLSWRRLLCRSHARSTSKLDLLNKFSAEFASKAMVSSFGEINHSSLFRVSYSLDLFRRCFLFLDSWSVCSESAVFCPTFRILSQSEIVHLGFGTWFLYCDC